MGFFSKPKSIDPNQIRSLMESDYTAQLDKTAVDLTDPNSAMNQNILLNAFRQGDDTLYTQNRMNRMNSAMMGGNQSGILQAQNIDSQNTIQNNITDAWQNQINQGYQTAIGITQNNQQVDSRIGDAMASAYGQNITNRNNQKAALGAGIMNLGTTIAGSFLCDARMKENIKKIGHTKDKNGNKIGLYTFNYKGRKKKHVSIIAQEVRKTNPEAVKKGKNGMLYVQIGKVFG
tara:strand:+ start:591 stop:1286 length:696 start_codon:yes stop_codon:yes gene_type:complete